MADNNNNKAPRGRQQNITGQGKDVYKRGDGLGTGPVGNAGGYQNRPGTSGSPRPASGGGTRAAGGKGGLILIVIAVIALIFGGGKLSSLFGGGSSEKPSMTSSLLSQMFSTSPSASSGISASSFGSLSSLMGTMPSANFSGTSSSSGWSQPANTGRLDTSVASGSRSKYTTVKGNGSDTVTIMIFMCGTDLESKNGMATSDLLEMTKANLSDKVNILVYTGGCRQWKNSIISAKTNQIYKVEQGGLRCLVDNDGAKSMTDPKTLSAFIKWCAQNYPANRCELIFWDHGGGSISGYGYDEKNSNAGSMNLTGINWALNDCGVKFDFIGFDACLMATAETALMLSDYADYMIASEETEPGTGWYYTNWLSNLSKDTSLATTSIGKMIVDDFVDVSAQQCAGQKTTLSLIDLAELEKTLPSELKEFAQSTLSLIQNDSYQTVSDARSGAREFATSTKIDQVDLVHLAMNLGTDEAKDMANAILGAVKYNRTSSNMTNAYGLSIYFPYRKTSTVSNAAKINDAIAFDSDYTRCIQAFASMQVGGHAVSQGTGSALPSLLGSLGGAASSSSSTASGMSSDMISSILGSLLGGSVPSSGGLSSSGMTSAMLEGFFGRSIDMESQASYLEDNRFDANLVWVNGSDGYPEMQLTDKQWSLVQDLELNVWIDDGDGFIDLGLDNVYGFKDNGALAGVFSGAWPAINGQPVAYYYVDTVDDGEDYTITGRIPCLLNGSRAEILMSFTDENPNGEIAGVRWIYPELADENLVAAKGLSDEVILTDGSTTLTIDFVCDYYTYEGEYADSYMLGDALKLKGTQTTDEEGAAVTVFKLNDVLTFSDVYINMDYASATYRFTDIYGQQYWTPVIP